MTSGASATTSGDVATVSLVGDRLNSVWRQLDLTRGAPGIRVLVARVLLRLMPLSMSQHGLTAGTEGGIHVNEE